MAGPDAVAPAVLDYLNHGTYPEQNEIASASLTSEVLATLVNALNQAQNDVKAQIRSQSKDTAPDIDSWIARAKELQTDILRSRDTARQIVAEAEAGEGLRAEVDDTEKKVALLEREVGFNETLFGTLEHVRYANGLLGKVQDEAVKGNVEKALDRLEDAEASIAGLQSIETTKAYELLHQRAKTLKESLVETATECWNALVRVDLDAKKISVQKEGLAANVPDAEVSSIGLESIVRAAQVLGVFDPLLRRLSKDIERTVLRPRLMADEDGLVAKLLVDGDALQCSGRAENMEVASLLRDLGTVLDFFASRLPSVVAEPLSKMLIPVLAEKLEEHWLEPAVPVNMSDLTQFNTTLSQLSEFADHIDGLGWHGSSAFHEWVQNAPRTWLTKRRETVLGDVRNLVFSGLRETMVVERVETQMLSREEAMAATGGGVGKGDDDWDTAWDEPEPESPVKPDEQESGKDDAEEEDMSAWYQDDDDANDDKPEAEDDTSAWDVEDDSSPKKGAGDEDEAWGWDDEESANKASAPQNAKASAPEKTNGNAQGGEREMTLRESFTVTAVPDGVLSILQQIVSDAELLAGPDFASSPIAPAAAALYTLPTLALAIYRATAPTAYTRLDTGNMLIYNDSSRLGEQLRSWQADRPATSRLRLDNDVKALETFAKRAYSTEMEAQRTILRDLVDGAQGFSNCTVAPYKAECESAIEQTVDRLRDVHRQWQNILSHSALLQSMGSLLATVTGKIITEIEDLGDIGEADSHQLRALIDRTTTIKDIFQQQQQQEGNQAQTGESEGPDMTFIYCPNWTKFLYMAEILDSSLADIKYMWKEGELSLEYDAAEIVDLIEALFAESELRRQAVREITRGAGARG